MEKEIVCTDCKEVKPEVTSVAGACKECWEKSLKTNEGGN